MLNFQKITSGINTEIHDHVCKEIDDNYSVTYYALKVWRCRVMVSLVSCVGVRLAKGEELWPVVGEGGAK